MSFEDIFFGKELKLRMRKAVVHRNSSTRAKIYSEVKPINSSFRTSEKTVGNYSIKAGNTL